MPSLGTDIIDQLAAAKTYRVEKPWGEEVIIEAQDFILKLITVREHQRTSLQHHEIKREVTVVVSGRGGVRGEELALSGIVRPSMPVVVEPGTIHRTVGPCLMIEVTTPENWDVVRHEDDYGRAEQE